MNDEREEHTDERHAIIEHRQDTPTKSRQMMDLTPRSFEEATKMADILANSDLVPKDYRGKAGNVLVAMQMGSEVGLQPMQAIQNIAVINGRPCVWGDALIGLVRSSRMCEYVREHWDAERQVAVCVGKRRGDEQEYQVEFGLEDAKEAGLLNKEGPWKQYRKRMCQMRARSWVCRDLFGDVLKGLQVAEEVMDIIDATPDKPRPSKGRATSLSEIAKQGAEDAEEVEVEEPDEKPAAKKKAPPVTLAEVMDGIEQAESVAQLKWWGEKASGLKDEEKTQARKAYKAKLLRFESETHGINPEGDDKQ